MPEGTGLHTGVVVPAGIQVSGWDEGLPFCWPRLPATTESLTTSKLSLPLTFLPLGVTAKRGRKKNITSVLFDQNLVAHWKCITQPTNQFKRLLMAVRSFDGL